MLTPAFALYIVQPDANDVSAQQYTMRSFAAAFYGSGENFLFDTKPQLQVILKLLSPLRAWSGCNEVICVQLFKWSGMDDAFACGTNQVRKDCVQERNFALVPMQLFSPHPCA